LTFTKDYTLLLSKLTYVIYINLLQGLASLKRISGL